LRPTIPFQERLTCTIPEACEATGLGRTKLYELIANKEIATVTAGRRRLVIVKSIVAARERRLSPSCLSSYSIQQTSKRTTNS
jgi:excisionase family DNA binding protein